MRYNNVVITFDIESSKLIKHNNEVISTKEWNDLSKEDKAVNCTYYGWMYIWMMYIDDEYREGRDWASFLDTIDYIKEKYNVSKNNRVIIWIHNLNFEWQFIKKKFEWIESEMIVSKGQKPIKVCTVDGIEFRCSYMYSNSSLGNLKIFGQPEISKKLGDLDYEKIRTADTPLTETEHDYCVYDVLVLREYIKQELKTYKDFSNFPLTATGKARQYVREKCLMDDNFKSVKKCLELSYDRYQLLHQVYTGGFTHGSPLHLSDGQEDVKHIDFTSSYPAVMVMEPEYPVKYRKTIPADKITPEAMAFWNERYAWCAMVWFKNIRAKVHYDYPISLSKCVIEKGDIVEVGKRKIDTRKILEYNGRVYKADHLLVGLTNIDFRYIKMFYEWDEMGVAGDLILYEKGYLPKAYIQCILDLYKGKTVLKGTDNEEEYQRLKALLNSLYGMEVQQVVKDELEYDVQEGLFVKAEADGKSLIKRYNKSKNRISIYEWGVWTTSLAKYNLLEGIYKIGRDYIYSDTDSIFYKGDHDDYIQWYNDRIEEKIIAVCEHYDLDIEDYCPKTIKGDVKMIGVWDFEDPCKRFKTIGAKRYIEVFYDGRVKTTFAGLNKKMFSQYMSEFEDPIEAFNDDLVVPYDRSGSNIVKLCENVDLDVVDYVGNATHVQEDTAMIIINRKYVIKELDLLMETVGTLRNWDRDIKKRRK